MRQFELDDIKKASYGDESAELRVRRRKEVLKFNQENRREAMALATPAWANKTAIAKIYSEAKRLTAETGIKHEVDHIVPILNKKVCGLHVEANLQILTKSENIRKHSKFDNTNISEQLEIAGVRVIANMRELKAALKAGKFVVVKDVFDKFYRINSIYGRITIIPIAESETAPLAIVSFSRGCPL